MSWMFRWLDRLVARLRSSEGADSKWVEPSNAITRAILSGPLLQPALPAPAKVAAIAAPQVEVAATLAEAEAVEAPDRAAAAVPVTRTAQRSRRRRASRAA